MKCKDIINELESLSPIKYACDWDNVGLMVGNRENEVKKILITIDVTDKVIDRAISKEIDLIISHHPLIFKKINRVSNDNIEGRKIIKLIKHNISVYSMHTNFDIVGGMGEIAGKTLGLNSMVPLDVIFREESGDKGLGVIGYLDETIDLYQLAKKVKEKFKIDDIKVYGCKNTKVTKVAMLPGSGKDFMEKCKENQVDVYITGDVSHHQGIDGLEMGFSIIDAGHYGMEKIFINFIKDFLEKRFEDIEINADIIGELFFTLPNY